MLNRIAFRNPFLYSLIRYIDSKLANDLENQKFVKRYCFFLNKTVIL